MRSINIKKYIVFFLIMFIAVNLIFPITVSAETYYNQSLKSGIENFPIEYQGILQNLKNVYPNANFEAYYTGISWDDLIEGETSSHGKNRVIASASESWKCDCGNVASGYACASDEIIKYYIDPRNFLNEVNIFQFLEITYNPNVHTQAGIDNAVSNTFLDNTVTFTREGSSVTMSYSQIIMDAARYSNMSPYSIVTKIIQEVGTQGSSSVSGTYPGYEGYYNYFNIGAYDTVNAIVNALEYAQSQGWDNPYDSILDGAKSLADSYTNRGQNTAYFYKWNVVGNTLLTSGNTKTVSSSNLFTHQYMTNVQDPVNQSKRLYNTYATNDLLDKGLNFIIPIFENESNTTNKLPTGIDTSNPNAYYVNDSDGVKLRSEASLSGTRLAGLSKDTVVLMIERKCIEADGYEWDKIQLDNGVVGYAASEFLSPCSGQEVDNSTNSETIIGKVITTDNLRLRSEPSTSGVKLATIPNGTELSLIQKDVANDGENIWYKVNYNGTVGFVSANYLTVIEENSNTSNSSSKGDVNGDGKANSADALKILKHSVDIEKISDNYLSAADVNGDGKVNSADALKILKYSVGLETL